MIKTKEGTVYVSYDLYLKSKDWKKKKKEFFKYMGNKICTMCGSEKNVHVHHFTYENIGKEKMEDLTYLCGQCHDMTHKIQKSSSGHEAVALLKAYQIRVKEAARRNPKHAEKEKLKKLVKKETKKPETKKMYVSKFEDMEPKLCASAHGYFSSYWGLRLKNMSDDEFLALDTREVAKDFLEIKLIPNFPSKEFDYEYLVGKFNYVKNKRKRTLKI